MVKILFLALGLHSGAVPLDSLRMETINGQAFIIHQVGERETLYSLSRRYGVPVVRVLEFNPTADGGIEVGQLLKIPYIPRTRVQTSNGTLHKVQPKETLFSISKMYDVSVDDLKSWNNLRDNSISVGQEVLIKRKETAAVTEIKPVETTQPAGRSNGVASVRMTHTVGPSETLYSISKLYNVSVEQVKAWNGLQSNDLKLNQVLYISQPMFQESVMNKPPDTVAQMKRREATTSVQVVRQEPVTLAATTPVLAGSPVKLSETVLGTEEVQESGLAELIEGTDGNRKYLALHRTAKPGSILKIRNELNNREVFVRVAGPLAGNGPNDDSVVIRISKSAYDRLEANDPRFRVQVTYFR